MADEHAEDHGEEHADGEQRTYHLRERRRQVERYEPQEPKPSRDTHHRMAHGSRPSGERRHHHGHAGHGHRHHGRSAAAKSSRSDRRHLTRFNSSSTECSDSDSEGAFERRRGRSVIAGRAGLMPINVSEKDVDKFARRRAAAGGSSLADIDPMAIQSDVAFDAIGGLQKHVMALREMVVLPLLYPEVFERFRVAPPRGILFSGPPGTGKTLVARALANECSRGDRKVAFFMRKGADCLSKWVGESERQLRLLFDQAYMMRPSIIFFDEIDGLAPVRSSRQDQIHSSIVSTLLALMDGLDSRGEVVVIGATNRVDAIDPALRRPGRFDREFLFPLPHRNARRDILRIHTRGWTPSLPPSFLDSVADMCIGYCGADLKALCTEAALAALRRQYPQIYSSDRKLLLDVSTLSVCQGDFAKAMQQIVPTAQRGAVSCGSPLAPHMEALLGGFVDAVAQSALSLLPRAALRGLGEASGTSTLPTPDGVSSGDDDDLDSMGHPYIARRDTAHHRLLILGTQNNATASTVAPAVLHRLEHIPVISIDYVALVSDAAARSPEEALGAAFREARRVAPSVVYMPNASSWWNVASESLRSCLRLLLDALP
eukprot:Opistho-2@50106